jgi:PadR family transcriptional regulator PadR
MVFQISGTLLDACVLAELSRGDAYGYALTQNVKETLEVSESTMYPVMRRLQTEAYLDVYDAPFGGRNRRYYSITERGREKLLAYAADWEEFKLRVNKLICKDEKKERSADDDGQ